MFQSGLARGAREGGQRQGGPQLGHAAPLWRDGFNHRDAQERGERVRVDLDAAGTRLVEHVQDEDHRPAEVGNLRREHQGATQVARVGYLHDHLRAAVDDHLPRHALVFAQHPFEGVDARRVDDVADLRADHRAPLRDGDGRARIVRHGGVPPGQAAEDDAFPDVGVADQGDA